MPKVYTPNPLGEGPDEYYGRFDLDRIRGRWSDEEDGAGCAGPGRGEAVILTGDGRSRWVLERWTNWAGETARHEPLHSEEAREWLERNGFEAVLAEHFSGGSLDDALHDLQMYGEIMSRRDEFVKAAYGHGAGIAQIARLTGHERPTIYRILGLAPGQEDRPAR